MALTSPSTQAEPAIAIVSGLAELAPRYDVLFCDVWGVLHDGVATFPAANDALVRFRQDGGHVVLVTNAPRPEAAVTRQLGELGTSPEAFDAVVTSGDVTRTAIAARGGQRMFRLGPDRDLGLFDGVEAVPSALSEAEFVVCTGLLDDETETVADYAPMLKQMRDADLTMICANPDLVVDRGGRLIPCAGALAAAYEAIGGTVHTAGKPHRPIYDAAFDRAAALMGGALDRRRVLAVGDAIRTDIAGARAVGLDALMIARGIHAAEIDLDSPTGGRRRALEWLMGQAARPTAVAPILTWS